MSDPPREPVPLSAGDVPSSFDDDPEFFEEGRAKKIWRKLKEEPLIPVGCLATCYALYQATKSIREGDHHQTNRMFRARIYAQGFTLVALLAGSLFYQDERMRRKKFEKAVEDQKALEKRDRWIRELEARDAEDRAWREMIEAPHREMEEMRRKAEEAKKAVEEKGREAKEAIEKKFSSKSAMELVVADGWGPGMWMNRIHEAWRRL